MRRNSLLSGLDIRMIEFCAELKKLAMVFSSYNVGNFLIAR